MRLEPAGSCDLATEFAAPFAIGVAGDMLGLSLDDVPRIRGFYDAFAGGMVYDGDPEPQRRADAARAEFSELLLGELGAMRRRAPMPRSPPRWWATPRPSCRTTTIVAQLRVILFGAIETIESMVLNTVMLLLDHPEQLDAVRADPELIPNAVEESLRLIPPVTLLERWSSAPGRGRRRRARRRRVRRRQHARRKSRSGGVRRSAAVRHPPRERPPRALVQLRRAPLPRLLDGPHAGRGWPSRRSCGGCQGCEMTRSSAPPGSCSGSPRYSGCAGRPSTARGRRLPPSDRSACVDRHRDAGEDRGVGLGVAAGFGLAQRHHQVEEVADVVGLERDHELLIVDPERVGGVDLDRRKLLARSRCARS